MATNILMLCTHNSGRSILAEGMLNHWARRRSAAVQAFSAGSAASGTINPMALTVLSNAGVDTSHLRSKSWDEYLAADAPRMRIVITLCDSAAAEVCPLWPGSPVKVHWSYPDPSRGFGPEQKIAFELTRQAIAYRMLQVVSLPLCKMADDQLQATLDELSRT